jgi:hypothetical protein
MNNSVIALHKYRVVIHDVLIFMAIYFLPAIAHWAPFPMAMLEPMRIFLFIGFILSYNRINAAFLAVTIPLFSSLATGHPVIFKAMLISTELLTHFLIFVFLFSRFRRHVVLIFVLALVFSKVIYYLLKSLFLNMGLIEGPLFTGGFGGQTIAIAFITILFVLIFNKSKFLATLNN